MMKLLIVEDEASLSEVMERALKAEGYIVETASAYDSALEKLDTYTYDCVLLDIMLPGGSGLDLLEHIRDTGYLSDVIVISAKDTTEDKVRGLELGADDYLAKPFHIAELIARIRSVSRRKYISGERCLKYGNVTVDPDTNIVKVGEWELPLLKKEYDILSFFMSRPGHLVDKTVLAEAVWGDHIDQADDFQFLYAQVKNLRKKLRDAGADIEIKAVYGFGYKMVGL